MSRYGSRATNKCVWSMNFDKGTLKAFLEGLANDASVANSGTLTYGTVSKRLAYETRVLYRMTGVSTHVTCVRDHGGFGTNPIWRVTPRLGKKGRNKCVKVNGIEELPSEEVYDIMTSTGEIYLPESDVVVHNCDDISLFAAWAIRDMMERGYLLDFRFVGLLSVPWLDEDGRCAGHNVCVVSYLDPQTRKLKWAHMSNWRSGQMQTHDKNDDLFGRVEDVVKDVLSGPSRNKRCTSVGWSRATCNLDLVEYGDGRDL